MIKKVFKLFLKLRFKKIPRDLQIFIKNFELKNKNLILTFPSFKYQK